MAEYLDKNGLSTFWNKIKTYFAIKHSEATASGSAVSVSDALDGNPISLKVVIEPVQSGSGDPSPTNVRPISGWTGVKVTRTGKNVLPNIIWSDWVSVSPYVVLKNKLPKNARLKMIISDRDTSVDIGNASLGFVADSYTGGAPQGYHYRWIIQSGRVNSYRLNIPVNNDATVYLSDLLMYPTTEETFNKIFSRYNIMIEVGTDDAEYEPYEGQTYSADWESEAGTVYGGTLDVTTGLLTVTHTYINCSDAIQYNQNNGYKAYRMPNVLRAKYRSQGAISNMISVFGSFSSASMNGNVIQLPSDATSIMYVALDETTDVSSLNVCYELAEPITYQLTPTEVDLLLNSNTIWADTGDSELTYLVNNGKNRLSKTEVGLDNVNNTADADKHVAEAVTVNGHTVNSDVPSGAKFTDTVTTATTTGSGNAVTAITASNGALTVTKGSTFLTAHQSNANLGQGYGTCDTAAATVAKVVTMANYVLAVGGIVRVKFTYSVPANATLNVNSKGAKPIYQDGSAINGSIIFGGDIATFMYDGTSYQLMKVDKTRRRTSTSSTITDGTIGDFGLIEVQVLNDGGQVNGTTVLTNSAASSTYKNKYPYSATLADSLFKTESQVNALIDAKIETMGGGDMLKSVYDTNNDGKVDSAAQADNATTAATATNATKLNGSTFNKDTAVINTADQYLLNIETPSSTSTRNIYVSRATTTPTANVFPKYDADAYLHSATPASTSNDNTVATTGWVNGNAVTDISWNSTSGILTKTKNGSNTNVLSIASNTTDASTYTAKGINFGTKAIETSRVLTSTSASFKSTYPYSAAVVDSFFTIEDVTDQFTSSNSRFTIAHAYKMGKLIELQIHVSRSSAMASSATLTTQITSPYLPLMSVAALRYYGSGAVICSMCGKDGLGIDQEEYPQGYISCRNSSNGSISASSSAFMVFPFRYIYDDGTFS